MPRALGRRDGLPDAGTDAGRDREPRAPSQGHARGRRRDAFQLAGAGWRAGRAAGRCGLRGARDQAAPGAGRHGVPAWCLDAGPGPPPIAPHPARRRSTRCLFRRGISRPASRAAAPRPARGAPPKPPRSRPAPPDSAFPGIAGPETARRAARFRAGPGPADEMAAVPERSGARSPGICIRRAASGTGQAAVSGPRRHGAADRGSVSRCRGTRRTTYGPRGCRAGAPCPSSTGGSLRPIHGTLSSA